MTLIIIFLLLLLLLRRKLRRRLLLLRIPLIQRVVPNFYGMAIITTDGRVYKKGASKTLAPFFALR